METSAYNLKTVNFSKPQEFKILPHFRKINDFLKFYALEFGIKKPLFFKSRGI